VTDPNDIIHIASGADPETGKAACFLEWQHIRKILDPDVILNTARELAGAAAAAEADAGVLRFLREEISAPDAAVAAVLGKIREARQMPEGRVALRIEAAAGHSSMRPHVRIGLGSINAAIAPADARAMAQQWNELAISAHLDARLRYVLGSIDKIEHGDIEDIFRRVRAVGGDQTTGPEIAT
jgi:hypothetical protein